MSKYLLLFVWLILGSIGSQSLVFPQEPVCEEVLEDPFHSDVVIKPGPVARFQPEAPSGQVIAVIPQPAHLQINEGAHWLGFESWLRICVKDQALLDMRMDRRVLEVVDPLGLGMSLCTHEGGCSASITLELGGEAEVFGSEGYRLWVSEGGIEIQAAKPVGVFYGIQTLRQLLPEPVVYGTNRAYQGWSVPHVEIVDTPRFPWRG
ncbi:MAG: glycoside hydrolase family 20 zincin-like fold domain-containing protein, partial [Planctomycetota bacterium]|nr:glycoside hydrolase family 20 zincin-like fold domain-containing protein [Planctomycetota bacterium]